MTLTRLKSIVSIPEYQNASSSSNSRLFASTTFSLSQNRNADLPILVTVSGRITFSIRWLLSKALEPILVTPSGTVTTFAFPLYLVRIPLALITKSGFSSVADGSGFASSFSPLLTCNICISIASACIGVAAGCKHAASDIAKEATVIIFFIVPPVPTSPISFDSPHPKHPDTDLNDLYNIDYPLPQDIFLYALT